MPHRLLLLAPIAPAVAVIAVAAASATGAALQDDPHIENALEDVQVGEAGNLMRVALICRMDCRVRALAGGVFFLPEIDTALDIDLAGRTKIAEALKFVPVDGGSALDIKAAAQVSKASIKPCLIDGLAASCIDIEYMKSARVAERPVETKEEMLAAAAPEAPSLAPERAPALREEAETLDAMAATPVAAAAQPALREAPGEAQLVFARLAAPERLEPPAMTAPAISASPAPTLTPATAPTLAAATPILRESEAARLLTQEFDLGARAEAILGRRFGVGECGGAQARLRSDAWALDAMVDVGFCDAASGELEKADGVFQRLLAYTPDNYEALVGRALIAAKSGERAMAKRYLQEALDALPPIEESNRIVETMAQL